MSKMFNVDDIIIKKAGEIHNSNLAANQHFDRMFPPGAPYLQGQAISVVVHQSDKRILPSISEGHKTFEGKVTFRRWQMNATILVEEQSITEEKMKDT